MIMSVLVSVQPPLSHIYIHNIHSHIGRFQRTTPGINRGTWNRNSADEHLSVSVASNMYLFSMLKTQQMYQL